MERVGWIGTGLMGAPMCGHILAGGYPVSVFNRSPAGAEALIREGATWCDTPRAVAENSDVVFTMVGYPHDVEQVLFGEQGVLSGLKAGGIVVDMTTSEPALAARIEEQAHAWGCHSLDAPVSGGDVGAREHSLAIMVGGERATFEQVLPLLKLMGSTISYMGAAGAGQHTKMTNQILAAGTMMGVVESLLYAQKTGLDLNAVIDVIGNGAASSWAINTLGRRVAAGDFSPGFKIRHFVKDMGIALDEARRCKLALPGLALAHEFYESAVASGLEEEGTQGLYKVLAKLNGMADT